MTEQLNRTELKPDTDSEAGRDWVSGLWSEGGGSWVSGSEGGGAGALTVSVPEWIIKLNPLSAQVFEIRTTDDLTEAWLKEKLSFFR